MKGGKKGRRDARQRTFLPRGYRARCREERSDFPESIGERKILNCLGDQRRFNETEEKIPGAEEPRVCEDASLPCRSSGEGKKKK